MTPARPPKFDTADLALIEAHPHSSVLERDLVDEIRNYQILLQALDARIKGLLEELEERE